MTIEEWKNSSYYNSNADIGEFFSKEYEECLDEVGSHYDYNNMTTEDWNNYFNERTRCDVYKDTEEQTDLHNRKLKDKSKGCYYWKVL